MDRISGQSPVPYPRRRIWWPYAAVAVAIVLIWTWIDGGEEPLRPMIEEIDVPGDLQ